MATQLSVLLRMLFHLFHEILVKREGGRERGREGEKGRQREREGQEREREREREKEGEGEEEREREREEEGLRQMLWLLNCIDVHFTKTAGPKLLKDLVSPKLPFLRTHAFVQHKMHTLYSNHHPPVSLM